MPTCFELILYQTQRVVVELSSKMPITSFLDVDCEPNTEIDFLNLKFYFRCNFRFISQWKCRFYRRNKPNHETSSVKVVISGKYKNLNKITKI